MRTRRRLVTGVCFTLVTVTACVLVGQRLTHSSWPLAHARMLLVGFAAVCYFASFILRARGWHRLFPPEQQPDQARCLASVGAAAASGVVLPFRLDYLVKVGTLRRLGGVRIGLQAVTLSIVSLGMVDAVAMLPLSVSATATSAASFRGPLLVVVVSASPAARCSSEAPAWCAFPCYAEVAASARFPITFLRIGRGAGVAVRSSRASTCSPAGRRGPWAAPCS